jgi:hypothetical protein
VTAACCWCDLGGREWPLLELGKLLHRLARALLWVSNCLLLLLLLMMMRGVSRWQIAVQLLA